MIREQFTYFLLIFYLFYDKGKIDVVIVFFYMYDKTVFCWEDDM